MLYDNVIFCAKTIQVDLLTHSCLLLVATTIRMNKISRHVGLRVAHRFPLSEGSGETGSFESCDDEAEGLVALPIPVGVTETVPPLEKHPLEQKSIAHHDITDTDWPEEHSKRFWNELQPKTWSALKKFLPSNTSLPYVKLLKKLLHLSDDKDREMEISIIHFVRLTKFFGPFAKRSDGSLLCLNTLKALTDENGGLLVKDKGKQKTCFIGYQERKAAWELLKNKEPGTYYIRFSGSDADEGTFSLDVVCESGEVASILILNDYKRAAASQPFRQFLRLDGDPNDESRTYSSLNDLVRDRLELPLSIDNEEVMCTEFGSDSELNSVFAKYKQVQK